MTDTPDNQSAQKQQAVKSTRVRPTTSKKVFARLLREFVDSHEPTNHPVDDSRESIYDDCGR